MLALSVSFPPKLCVTIAETQHMAIYLRTFFRVLSTWVRKYDPTLGRKCGPALNPTGRNALHLRPSRRRSERAVFNAGFRPSAHLEDIEVVPATLEDVFQSVTGHRLRD